MGGLAEIQKRPSLRREKAQAFISCFEIIALVLYTTFPAIFTFLIGHVATATLPLPKVKLSRKIHITNFGNHFKTASPLTFLP